MSRHLRVILGRELLEQPLMRQALTHRSAGSCHNERLEFLGDAVLGMIVSDLVYHRFPSFSEGEMTRLRSYLVREDTLAGIARAAGLASLIVTGPGETGRRGRMRGALLADTLEAVIGAIYLLRGAEWAARFVSGIFGEHLANPPAPETLKDAKTRLQEYLQADGRALPIYELRGQTGCGAFRVACRVTDLDVEVVSEAASKRKAEQQAAAGVLRRLPPH